MVYVMARCGVLALGKKTKYHGGTLDAHVQRTWAGKADALLPVFRDVPRPVTVG